MQNVRSISGFKFTIDFSIGKCCLPLTSGIRHPRDILVYADILDPILYLVGQSVAALAQPYLMFATTKLAALWFPEEHRALANTIGSMCK